MAHGEMSRRREAERSFCPSTTSLRSELTEMFAPRASRLISWFDRRVLIMKNLRNVSDAAPGNSYGNVKAVFSKVPEVTLVFWIIKIAATTLGETGGDAVSMTAHLGYAIGSVIFIAIFVVAVAAQITAKSFHPFLYWAVIVATTTAGTTMADFADRSLGIGYAGGASILFVLVMAALGLWYWVAGSISVDSITTPKVESFYWGAILFSQTLGTALGDWMADTTGLGYEGGALVFGAGLILIAAAYFYTNVSHTLLFWSAFILTR